MFHIIFVIFELWKHQKIQQTSVAKKSLQGHDIIEDGNICLIQDTYFTTYVLNNWWLIVFDDVSINFVWNQSH